ncbi:MAG: hypothetical protein ACJA0N_001945 [Pseudohongiellaceae bacterium]
MVFWCGGQKYLSKVKVHSTKKNRNAAMTFKKHIILLVTFVILLVTGCGNAPVKVQRIAVDDVQDLSGNWNDTDSKLVSSEMVEDMLSRPWLQQHMQKRGNSPSVIVGSVDNYSHEHVNVQTFINDIERELINSGRVTFVADGLERQQLRDERMDQDINAADQSRKAMGQELGADYLLLGTINTILDSAGKTSITYYQVDLKLVSLTDNRTSWIGQKKIKKIIKGRKSRY